MFRIILLCLLTCCSSFMPLKQSESIVSEDHTQVVERKTKENYYAERQYDVLYSINQLASDVYWINMIQMLQNESLIFLGGTTNVSCYDVFNGNAVWNASQSTLDSMHLYYVDNSSIVQFASNDFWISSANFSRLDQSGNYIKFRLRFVLSTRVLTITFDYNSYYDSQLNFYGCYFSPSSQTNYSDLIISLPKSNCGISQNADTTGDYDTGYYNGYNNGYLDGYNNRQVHYDDEVYQNGYDTGYTAGVAYGISETLAGGTEAMTIFAGIMDVAFIPVNVFFLMFDYEVFGINIAGFVSGLLTLAIVIILMRFIFGRRV